MAKEGEFFESQNVTANQQSSVCQFLRRSKTVWHVKIQTLPLEPGAGGAGAGVRYGQMIQMIQQLSMLHVKRDSFGRSMFEVLQKASPANRFG